MVYQAYRTFVAFTWGMVLLTVFDIFIVWITAREYRHQRPKHAAAHVSSGAKPL
jgi:uncharacterized membrane protein